jgi:hypothetical protein
MTREEYRRQLKEGLDYTFGVASRHTGVTEHMTGICGNGGTGGTCGSTFLEIEMEQKRLEIQMKMANARYQAIERYAAGWTDPFMFTAAVAPVVPEPELIEIPPPTFTLRWYHRVLFVVYRAAVWMRDKL